MGNLLFKRLLPFYIQYQRCASAGNLYISYYKYVLYKISDYFGKAGYYYPIPQNCTVVNINKIYVGYNSPVFRPGCYIQGEGTIQIGNYVQVAQNVGIVSTNHDVNQLKVKHPAPIIIGDYCWLGMNSVVTAGVTLGPHTIVGAGSVVTKSFPDGYVVIAGCPAKVIRHLDKKEATPYHNKEEYYGFLSKEEFQAKYEFRDKESL